MTISHVKRSFPHLKKYAERKLRRKFKTDAKLSFRRHGRVGMAIQRKNGKHRILVSQKLAKKNAVLAKAVIVHELTECLCQSHNKAMKLESQYLKEHGTSYRKEASQYRRA